MVIIYSREFDSSTDSVLLWLNYLGIEVIRINETKDLPQFSIEIGQKKSASLSFNYLQIISGIWFRKKPACHLPTNNIKEGNGFNQKVFEYINAEFNTLYSLFGISSNQIKILGQDQLGDLNKIYVLQLAKKIGFNIPKTLVTNNRDEINKFSKKHARIIIKPLSNPFSFSNNKGSFQFYTEILSNEEIQKLPIKVFPSLLQECIEKYIELRVFYLGGKQYGMAIFSQQDEKTEIDYRKYNHDRPNRTVPFELPESIRMKIERLMVSLGLNTGSIDLIYSTKKEYYFLEVNPAGQFENVSECCNYFLERKIANYLIQ